MGHRGARGYAPENTLLSFERAAALGADALEMDIHRCADGPLVVMHNDTVDEVTDGHGALRSLTLAEIKRLDAGYRWTADGGQTYPFRGQGLTIPTLAETLEAFPHLPFNIDIKPVEPGVVAPFVDLLAQYNKLDQVVVGSFHDRQINLFRRLCPQVPTAAGPGETRLFYALNQVGLARAFRPKAWAFQVPETVGRMHLVTPGFVRAAHAHHLQVHVWTVNETAEMARLLEWGVDGLISDYPDRALSLLGR